MCWLVGVGSNFEMEVGTETMAVGCHRGKILGKILLACSKAAYQFWVMFFFSHMLARWFMRRQIGFCRVVGRFLEGCF